MEGLKAAVADAASMAYSKAAVESKENEPLYSVELGGGEHGNLQYGYPTTDTSGLVQFMELNEGYHDLSKEWVWAAHNHGTVSTPDYWIATQSKVLGNYSGSDFNSAIESTKCYVKYTAAMEESAQIEVISETSGC
ncbi:V10 pilin [Vibrio maerlii]|uniref:V10 pilin n=1 Tax=Vibrio maerlii TaxID=2231648 RepID=UPI0030B878EF